MAVLENVKQIVTAAKDDAKAKVAYTSAVGEGKAKVGEGKAKVGERRAKVACTSAVGDVEPDIDQENIGTMYLCCADLFPAHETTFSRATFRGILPSCSNEFKELVKDLLF